MRSLHRAVQAVTKGGTPLPVPYRDFSKFGINLRRSEVTMIVGQPGAGKSTVALDMAMKMKVPTLYFSMDSGEDTMGIRTLSMITGESTSVVEQRLEQMPDRAAALIKQHADHIKWVFDAETLWDLEEEVDIYRELMGSNPLMVVIDNATDLAHESGDEYSSLRSLMREVKRWSRELSAAFVVLHHTSEGYDGNPCPPLRSVHGKVSQKPATVLSIGDASGGFLPIAPVKNRNGFQDRTGGTAVYLRYDPSVMMLKDADL